MKFESGEHLRNILLRFRNQSLENENQHYLSQKVSVVISTLGRSSIIPTLRSIINQDILPMEIVIYPDGREAEHQTLQLLKSEE